MSGKTITIRDPDVKLLRDIQLLTGKGTASQAFIAAGHRAIALTERVDELQEQIRGLCEQVAVYQRTLREAHAAAVQLAEVAGQGDMFTPSSDNPLRPGFRR